ncbi:hypothetical protein ACEU07_09930 [Chromobacterium violaceum]|uniref:hypothetical protein n=1 Tax=Chromobacterium violaceum TaxID=536 RepID=UPI0035A5E62D
MPTIDTGMHPIWTKDTRAMALGGTTEINTGESLTIHWGVPDYCASGIKADVWIEKIVDHDWALESTWVKGYKMTECADPETVHGKMNYAGSLTIADLPRKPGLYRIKVKTFSLCGGGQIKTPCYVNLLQPPSLAAPKILKTKGISKNAAEQLELSVHSTPDLFITIANGEIKSGTPVQLVLTSPGSQWESEIHALKTEPMPESNSLKLSIPNACLRQLQAERCIHIKYFINCNNPELWQQSHSASILLKP